MGGVISYLRGNLLTIERGKLIIDCNGVGYLVSVPTNLVNEVIVGKEVEVFTYTYVKEDVVALFGFKDLEGLRLFERLISVSGIGPKTGMSIMMAGNSSEIVGAIRGGKVDFFTKVPGIGKKNAQRLIVELRNKLGGDADDVAYLSEETEEVVEALMNLGFSKKDAIEAVKQVDKSLPVEDQIKLSLKLVKR
jgi:Holliday junction DNA helicase RuvA